MEVMEVMVVMVVMVTMDMVTMEVMVVMVVMVTMDMVIMVVVDISMVMVIVMMAHCRTRKELARMATSTRERSSLRVRNLKRETWSSRKASVLKSTVATPSVLGTRAGQTPQSNVLILRELQENC